MPLTSRPVSSAYRAANCSLVQNPGSEVTDARNARSGWPADLSDPSAQYDSVRPRSASGSPSVDISLSSLLSQLQRLYNDKKKIDIVILMFGNKGDFTAMQAIAKATGGAAFQVTNPAEIGQVFIQAVSQRMCNPSC